MRKGKDERVSELIQIGLGVSFENGCPIFHKSYDGTISNIKILESLMKTMAQRDINTIVMDTGFYKYFDKDVAERSFRTMKGDVQLHPIRLWMPKRVNAHIKISYLSMRLLSLIKLKCRRIATSSIDIINELQTIYKVQMVSCCYLA